MFNSILKFDNKNCKWWILFALSFALALVFIDQTAISVALPTIQRSLNLNSSLIQWVINAYLLALSAFILLSGKIGDQLGHKHTFLFGVILFIIASILCAFANSGSWLIAARAIQGIGGAFILPSTSALLVSAFPGNERGKALGIYLAVAAIFLALGPLLGGFLTQVFSWRAVFWINFPIALASITLTIFVVPRPIYTEKLSLDWLGLFISGSFVCSFVLAFMQAPHWGWTSKFCIGLFLYSILSFIAFILWERKAKHPLIDLKLFKNHIFSIITLFMVIIQAVGTVVVFWSIFLQTVLFYGPLKAGILLSPAVLPMIFMAPIAGYLLAKYDPILPMVLGCSLVTLSLAWIGVFSHSQHYAYLFPGLLAYGVGMPLILSPSMTTAMSTVHAQQYGVASAILNCARQFGTSIGLAVLAGLLSTINKWQLTSFFHHSKPPLSSLKEKQIDGLLVQSVQAMQAISHLSVQSAKNLKTIMLQAYTSAFSFTMFAATILAVISLLLILRIPRKK